KRMFVYAYRIYDKYQKPIISCAILTDSRKNWRPCRYEVGLGGSKLTHEYLIIKLIDYETNLAELENSKNPFANVILMQLAAIKAKNKSSKEQYRVKINLTKRLYGKGFNKSQILKLYLFLDWILHLAEELEIKYKDDVYQIEESKKMAYVSSIE